MDKVSLRYVNSIASNITENVGIYSGWALSLSNGMLLLI